MSILPILGHKPITSYFSRTSSAKRKRKEDKTAPPSPEGISKRPKQFPCSSRDKATKWANGSARSSRDKVDSPCTPPVNHPWIPPLACMAVPRPREGPENVPGDRLEENDHRLSIRTSHRSSGMSASFLVASNVTNSTSTMPEFIIPSSQSQDIPSMEVDMLTPFSGNLSLLRPIGGEDVTIESSQTQLLIMASPNVQKLELEPTLPSFDIVIPSSQSQEEELAIPTEKDLETGAKGMYPVRTAQRGFEIPKRTISEAIFLVPIQDSINPLLDEQELYTPPVGNNPDSVADSETEDEHDGLPNSFYKEPSTPWNVARASGDSQSSLGIGSYSSLPSEVWEFRKMFENGDGSYPADFPESLRS